MLASPQAFDLECLVCDNRADVQAIDGLHNRLFRLLKILGLDLRQKELFLVSEEAATVSSEVAAQGCRGMNSLAFFCLD